MVVVAIPTYNRPLYLSQLIKSVPAEIPVFISDNGGLTPTDSLPSGRSVVIDKLDYVAPIFANWNNAVRLAAVTDGYVVIPSDDDLFLPGAFDVINRHIADYPNVDIFIFGVDIIDGNGSVIGNYSSKTLKQYGVGEGFCEFKFGVNARMPGVVFKQSFLDSIGYFDETLTLTAADSELVQRALLLGTAVFSPEKISAYRVWEGSLTSERQCSAQWVEEVDYWTAKIVALAEEVGFQKPINWPEYRDEILAQNILAGMRLAIQQGNNRKAMELFRGARAQRHALLKTRIFIALRLASLRIKILFFRSSLE